MRSFAREATKIAAAMARAERDRRAARGRRHARGAPARLPRAARGGRAGAEDVSFAYDAGRPALRDVTLRIARGERVAVMGASGAGKSTLGALVARLTTRNRAAC